MLFFLLVVIFAVLAAAGALDLTDPAFSGGIDLQRTAPVWMYAVTYGLIFVYYTLFEALTAASVGKLVFRMRVTMDDGTRPSGLAVVVRNLVRLPEVLFWYIPSGISCLANPKNKRLGDLAAETVVVRRSAAPAGVIATGTASPRPGAAPLPPAPGPARRPRRHGVLAGGARRPARSEALAGLKTAALAVRGAHLNYLRFSEVELAKGAARPAGEPAEQPGAQPEPDVFAGVRGRLVHARRRRHRHAAGACSRDRGGDARGHDAAGPLRGSARRLLPLPGARALLHGGLRRAGARRLHERRPRRDDGLERRLAAGRGRATHLRQYISGSNQSTGCR